MQHRFIAHVFAAGLLGLAASQALAFGGSIAVGMGQLNETQQVDVAFSADATLQSEEHTVQETIYYTPGKVRDEVTVSGQDLVVIQRHDLNKLWTLMPQGIYLEVDIDEPIPQAVGQTDSYRLVEHEVVGQETVNGMRTTKHRSVYETDDGRFHGFTWVTDDGIAVRAHLNSESQGRSGEVRFEITRLDRGAQPEHLFTIPDGYSKMSLGNLSEMAQRFQSGAAASGQHADAAPAGETPPSDTGTAVREGAEEAVRAETRDQVGRKVREGLRGLFGG